MRSCGWGDIRRVYGVDEDCYLFAQRLRCVKCDARLSSHSDRVLAQMDEAV